MRQHRFGRKYTCRPHQCTEYRPFEPRLCCTRDIGLYVHVRLWDLLVNRWIGGVTALATLKINPALGLILGWIAELVRAMIVRRLLQQRLKP